MSIQLLPWLAFALIKEILGIKIFPSDGNCLISSSKIHKYVLKFKLILFFFLNTLIQRDLQLTRVEDRFRETFITNDTHLLSTITLENATVKDTGYYRFIYGDVEIKQYVYVYG